MPLGVPSSVCLLSPAVLRNKIVNPFSSRTSTEQLYFHRQYLRSSRLWNSVCPRPSKFTIIFASYRALLLNSSPDYIASKEWHSEVTALNSAEESQLRKSTSLPPAGEINKPYLKFLDDVAESWRIGGAGREGAAEAVEVRLLLSSSFSANFELIEFP